MANDYNIPSTLPDPAAMFWPATLVIDVALGVNDDTLCSAYDMQHHMLQRIKESPIFLAQLRQVQSELAKDGASFRLKAQAQADALLTTSWEIIQNGETPANVRADLIKATVKWAGLDGKDSETSTGSGGFSININLGGINPSANSVKVKDIDGDG